MQSTEKQRGGEIQAAARWAHRINRWHVFSLITERVDDMYSQGRVRISELPLDWIAVQVTLNDVKRVLLWPLLCNQAWKYPTDSIRHVQPSSKSNPSTGLYTQSMLIRPVKMWMLIKKNFCFVCWDPMGWEERWNKLLTERRRVPLSWARVEHVWENK